MCCGRSSGETKAPAVWQISRVAKKAIYLGKVEAADAAAAIKRAIEKYDIAAEHQGRLAARPITTSKP